MNNKILATTEIKSFKDEVTSRQLVLAPFDKNKHEEQLIQALLIEPPERLQTSFGKNELTPTDIQRILTKAEHLQVLQNKDEEMIGFGSLAARRFTTTNQLELGIYIFNNYAGQGYGSILGLSLIQHAHTHLAKDVLAQIHGSNTASYKAHIRMVKYFPENRVQCKEIAPHYHFIFHR